MQYKNYLVITDYNRVFEVEALSLADAKKQAENMLNESDKVETIEEL